MRNTILFVACLVAFSSALDCNVTLPRLLLGDRYSNSQSNELALLIFDTADYCDQGALISLGSNTFQFNLKEIVTQHVNETLSHSGWSVEYVQYLKYSIVFAIQAQPDVTYSIGFLGNKNLPESRYALNYTFKLPRLQENFSSLKQGPLKVAFFGDQDLTTRGANTLAYMNSHTDVNKFDAFVFLGDYAYEFYQNNGTQGDQYLEQFAPLSFSYPLAMTPGNHENNLNFTLFNEKFRLPSFNEDNLNNINSFKMGLVHFLHVNLDYFYISSVTQQQTFLINLENQLKNVNRLVTPWLIAVGHKLMYCYNYIESDNSQCTDFYAIFFQIDALFQKYHVDFFITGHEHFNQVMAPMSNQTIHNYTLTNTTINSNLTRQHLTYNDGGYISIIQGNGGCYNSHGSSRLLQEQQLPFDVFNKTLSDANLFLNLVQVGFGWIEVVDSHNIDYFTYDAEREYIITSFRFTTNHGFADSQIDNFNNYIPKPVSFKKNPILDCLFVGRNATECLKSKVGLQME